MVPRSLLGCRLCLFGLLNFFCHSFAPSSCSSMVKQPNDSFKRDIRCSPTKKKPAGCDAGGVAIRLASFETKAESAQRVNPRFRRSARQRAHLSRWSAHRIRRIRCPRSE